MKPKFRFPGFRAACWYTAKYFALKLEQVLKRKQFRVQQQKVQAGPPMGKDDETDTTNNEKAKQEPTANEGDAAEPLSVQAIGKSTPVVPAESESIEPSTKIEAADLEADETNFVCPLELKGNFSHYLRCSSSLS